MWKSAKQRRQDEFELALAEMPAASLQVAEKWRLFCDKVVYKAGVPLAEQVRAFSIPLAEFFRSAYPNISKTDPIVYLATLLIGVYLAKTHPIPEVLRVAAHVENELGVCGVEELVAEFIKSTPNR